MIGIITYSSRFSLNISDWYSIILYICTGLYICVKHKAHTNVSIIQKSRRRSLIVLHW